MPRSGRVPFASSVQGKIASLVLAAAALTVLCSGIFIVQTRANIETHVYREQTALGQTYARVVQEYLDGSRSVLEGLARVPSVRARYQWEFKRDELNGVPDYVDVDRRASAQGVIEGTQRVLTVFMAGLDGEVYMFEPYAKQLLTGPNNLNTSQANVIEQVIRTQKPTFSDVIVDGWTNRPTVMLQVPVWDDAGLLMGVLGASLSLDGLADAAQGIHTGQTRSVILVDRLGTPVVYPDATRVSHREPLTDMPLVARALAGEVGSFAYLNPLTSQDELGSVVALDNGWYVIVTTTQSDAFQGLNRTVATLLIVLALSVSLLLGAGLYLARSIARGLGIVARAATGLASGDLDQRVDVWSRDEVGRMAAAFREMMAYHQQMASIADAVAAGDLRVNVQPQSDRDRLGIALSGMIGNLRSLMADLRLRDRALAAATSPVLITDARSPDCVMVYANPAVQALTGYSESELVGQGLLSWPDLDPSTREWCAAVVIQGRADATELVAKRRDGTPYWIDVAVAPVRGDNGPVSHHVWVLNDTTARKEAEKQAQSLARSEKLRALGQMASGVAHDLNQSLMLIASYGELGGRSIDRPQIDRDELREIFTVVTQAAMTGGETVKRLLQFARTPIEGPTQPVDLTRLAREVAQLTAPRWRDAAQAEGRPITLDVETSGHPTVLGAQAPLREALTNLILNAADALPAGGAITVRVSQTDDQACLEVIDNGVGMPPEVQSRIFEPFFTTKGDRGTGLGLAMVFGIVERLGGTLKVHSAPGLGTTIRMQFKAATRPEPTQLDALAVRRPAGDVRQLRILAVDDEPALTRAVSRLLRPIGHVVTTASSGEEALEKLGSAEFDLVLSDVGMGSGMNGWELAEHVRRGWPGTRVALATGWGAAIDADEARAKGIVAVLAKPYSAADLENVLHAA